MNKKEIEDILKCNNYMECMKIITILIVSHIKKMNCRKKFKII